MIWIDVTLRVIGSLLSLAFAVGLITSWVDMYRQGFDSRLQRVSFYFNSAGVLGVAIFLMVIVNIAIWKNLYL